MEEEKTLAIPLGGSTAEGEKVHPTSGPVESAASGASESRQKSAIIPGPLFLARNTFALGNSRILS